MNAIIEIFKMIILTLIIVLASKYIIVVCIRKLAETLNLRARTVGNISGIATSIPELLTVSFSAATGFIATGIFNVLSSNIINFILYASSIIVNKNTKILRNQAIVIELILSIVTIIIPIFLISVGIEINLVIVPVFILLYILFYYIDINAHKLYLQKEESEVLEKIKKETKRIKGKKRKTILYASVLVITMIVLFFVGDMLSGVLEKLCIKYGLPELLLGILLGATTSIPELITFLEAQRHHAKSKNKDFGVIEATNNLLSSNLLCLFIIQSIGIIIYTIIM